MPKLILALASCVACSKADPGGAGSGGESTAGELVLSVDADMVLQVHASWTDPGASASWLEYRFESEEWSQAPTLAPGEAVILGIPPEVEVEARAAMVVDGETLYTALATATTGSLPRSLVSPDVEVYDPGLASSEGYALISVSGADFGFDGPFWLEVLDRQGRVVWYEEIPDDLFSLNASIARDGTHIWFEQENIIGYGSNDKKVTRKTLDGRWSVVYPLDTLGQAIAEGPDNSFFFERRIDNTAAIDRLDRDGQISEVWNCEAHFASIGADPSECLLNSCLWDEARNTLLASQFETSTVFEVDVGTGEVLRQMGEMTEGDPWTFDPPESGFAYQHAPHWTPEGTLLVSTHIPCEPAGPFDSSCDATIGTWGVQHATEYEVDDATQTLHAIFTYESTDRWATQAGEAFRLPNGNLLVGYGQDGALREVTPDGQIAWDVSWRLNDTGMRLVGHAALIADLYALNVGQ